MKNEAQQGDVLFNRVEKLPDGLKKAKLDGQRYVLAEGEATGHAHAVYNPETCDVFVDENGTIFMEAKKPTIVEHEEHKPVVVDPGVYEIGIVKEFDPFAEEIRRVRD